jgi:hypothetical protein
VEVAGPVGTNLNDYRLHLYHGATDGYTDSEVDVGTWYVDFALSGIIPNMRDGFGVKAFRLPSAWSDRGGGHQVGCLVMALR